MRLSATKAMLERRDVVVVASVSAIYGLGDPDLYLKMMLHLTVGMIIDQRAIGELFISALGLAMIAALVPQHLMGFILGMWFLTQAAAFLLGGYVATFTAVPDNITDPLETLPVYTNVFGKIGLVTLGVAVVMLLMVPWLKRMIATPESH